MAKRVKHGYGVGVTFDGKVYSLYKANLKTKAGARAIAERQRRGGFRARVVRMKRLAGKSLWGVYLRREETQ